nr:hypothetical protein BAR15_110105 [Bartonella sp. AR 15-3]
MYPYTTFVSDIVFLVMISVSKSNYIIIMLYWTGNVVLLFKKNC